MPSTKAPILTFNHTSWPAWFTMLKYQATTIDAWKYFDPDAPSASDEFVMPAVPTIGYILAKRRDEISKHHQELCAIWDALPEESRGDKPSRAPDPTPDEIITLAQAQRKLFLALHHAWDSRVSRRKEISEWISKTVESKLFTIALMKVENDGLDIFQGLIQTLREMVCLPVVSQ